MKRYRPCEYKYQGQERQDEMGLNWDSFNWRNYDYAIGRFMSIDPLAEKYAYNSPYAFAENKLGMGRELEGLELAPFMTFSNTPPVLSTAEVVRVGTDVGVKSSELAAKTEAAARLSENAQRGSATEAEQLAQRGLDKNTESIEATDPTTGQTGNTIPDSVKPDGGTVEVKNIKNQSLTKQLRLQRAISNARGVKPELIINKTANLSKPLLQGGFDINVYNTAVIESTGISTPKVRRDIGPKPVEIIEINDTMN